ncbi:DNA damage-inducible protein D [uncultured Adlercreutzia sp.]|uniref:DNA damage-inducible protein D n=1 Tax=uncultured Adlercreutzia sp. TaxID=875803 RepID=UPI0026F3FDF5|nr:DNA damage-inducible protein D [uncultured Adlercreutzia sp.]
MKTEEIQRRALSLDDCIHVSEMGVEFWYAREIMEVFGYTKWQNFEIAIKRASVSLQSSKTPVKDHFADVSKMVSLGSGSQREIRDYKLTRYACYLIAQNGDPRKEEIAFAQSYFALQTRKQELIEERMAAISRIAARDGLSEAEKLFSANMFERDVTSAGVGRIRSKGDRALFGGVTTSDMKKRLGVSSGPLADHLPAVTIAAKQLATEITNHNMVEDDLRDEEPITKEHVQNNTSVRGLLRNRGIVPENLPAEEDVKKLRRKVEREAKELEAASRGLAG